MSATFSSIQVGDAIPSLTKGPIEQSQINQFAVASGDGNPIHTDPEVAKSAGLDGTIAHGMLIMAFAGQMLTEWLGPHALRNFKVRFKGMTVPGDVLSCTGTVNKKYEQDGEYFVEGKVSVKGQDERPRVTGSFVAVVPE
jgi:acyl dehydratase